jgi:hypothetical protein
MKQKEEKAGDIVITIRVIGVETSCFKFETAREARKVIDKLLKYYEKSDVEKQYA